jgi:hypothetical protein
MSKPVVFIGYDCIFIADNEGEIVYWDSAEWHEDPDIIVPITEAIRLALTEGAEALREHLQQQKHLLK